MKRFSVCIAMLLSALHTFSQKQTFDVVSFTAPKGWKQQQNEAGIQLSATDKKTGAYAIAIITRATQSTGSADKNFNSDWEKLIKGTVQVTEVPVMQEPSTINNWDIISGTAGYTDGSQKGLATLLTATGGGQMVSLVLMTNSDLYQNDLLSLLQSMEMDAVRNQQTNKTIIGSNAAIVGLWTDYLNETSGYMNGMPMYSGGYFRKEYAFYGDGTYLFRVKNWSVTTKEILFVYETGNYTIAGNKITIQPKQGKGGWWAKAASGRTEGWGNKVKTATWNVEAVTYDFDLKDLSEKYLFLQSGKQTEREGKQENNKASYRTKRFNETMIDNPPGIKTGFENKQPSTNANLQPENGAAATTIHAPIAGKIWEAQSLEKHGAAYGNASGFHTGGFWIYQYKFDTDGTYHFIYNAASANATNPVNVLQYESGTYTVNGNSITIMPTAGANEEWSVGKINNGMSAETKRNILEKRIKKLKTTQRKLEKMTYPFTIEYWQGNNANALCLKHTQETIREGSPGQNDQSCFFATKAPEVQLK